MEKNIIIGITQGDINGIGYEVILKTLSEPRVYENFTPIIYGSAKVANYHRKVLDIQGINLNIINHAGEAVAKKINIINCSDEEAKVEFGKSTPEAGKAAFDALERATADMKTDSIDALVTAPISKHNIQSSNFKFPGHTEYLEANFATTTKALMVLINDVVRVAVVTGHIPVSEVAHSLTTERIVEKIETLNAALKQDFSIVRPRIAILGLNPHAGDNGVIGNDEETQIVPAIKIADQKGIIVVGPYPADGFFGSGQFKKFDAVLAMYHDQGLIPFKTISMDNGLNYTAGLSVVRTSPAHGTAFDLAGMNKASEQSFRQALFMAYDVVNNRRIHAQITANPLKIEPKQDRHNRIE